MNCRSRARTRRLWCPLLLGFCLAMGACQLDVPDEDASVQDHELLQCGSTFSDAFTRGDSAVLDNGWQQVTGGLEIHSNEARSSALKATLSRAIRPSSTGPDQDVRA